jgi:primosomal protein N' (replication factor Y)
MTTLYVDLAIPVAVDKLFTYKVPTALQSLVHEGVRVMAPFGMRTVVGFVVEVKYSSGIANTKPIRDVLDHEPTITTELIRLAKWMSDYYYVPLGEVLKSMTIRGFMSLTQRMVTLVDLPANHKTNESYFNPSQTRIITALQTKKTMSVKQLQIKCGVKNIYASLGELAKQGIVQIYEQLGKPSVKPKTESVAIINPEDRIKMHEWLATLGDKSNSQRYINQVTLVNKLLSYDLTVTSVSTAMLLKAPGVSLSSVRSLINKRLFSVGEREIIRSPEFNVDESSLRSQNIILNQHQKTVLEEIVDKITLNVFHTFLLHGVTGSGKTQVYIEAIKEAVRREKTAIVLVPEISLTPQTVRRFKAHFGDRVAVMHSRMSTGERYDAWRMANDGRCFVIVGPRSAIFAPVKNLGLVVVDEEHEASYKQFDQSPRYHGRDVAIMRALLCNAVIILGSATPSVESYANALSGKYTLIELPERADNAKLPEIQIVDMTKEKTKKIDIHRERRREDFKKDPVKAKLEKRKFEFGSISDILKEKIEDRLRKKEGIILLQNRRGFSPFIECPDCGHVEMCPNCNISLTYHLTQQHLRCHYCGIVKQQPIFCPTCQSIDIQYRGFGTQRVEEELMKLFPTAKLLRMDLDTTSTRGAHDKLLKQFSDGKADILLGTQMVAKGLDIARVTLVGVISADTQMLLPDFRSSERTFQLLTQVAGRAGRSNLAGEVIIQTYQPKHSSMQYVLTSKDFMMKK